VEVQIARFKPDVMLDRTMNEAPEIQAPEKEIDRLVALGPDAQGDVDESLLRDNLRLSPAQRLEAASMAANGVETLRAALQRALDV
jgi:hypothetical protein